MKRRIILVTICCLSFCYSFSYSDSKIRSKDLKNLIGCWEGSLTYLDYSTNKPFSMPANIIVKDFKRSNTIICSLIYPKEPNANSADTIFISKDGRSLNNAAVKTKRSLGEDSLEIVTEIAGIDGNDHKDATIRHTYILGKNNYSTKKEVQFVGQTQWIVRNEYKFNRMKQPCN
jgi:hypothetical protein